MSDAELRRLERAYRALPTEENKLRWLAAKRRAAPDLPEPPDLNGKRFVLKGYRAPWPAHFLGSDPADEIRRRGGAVVETVSPDVDYVVLGSGREKGKAAAERAVNELQGDGQTVELLDEAGLHVLLRPDLRGCRFVFGGGFECAPGGLDGLTAMVRAVGAEVVTTVTDEVDFVVIGSRRGKGKAAIEKAAKALIEAGSTLRLIPEETFQGLVAATPSAPGQSEGEAWLDMGGLLVELQKSEDAKRVKKAVQLLAKKPVRLVVRVTEREAQGVFPSTSGEVYGLFVADDGRYACGHRRYDGVINECPGQGWNGPEHVCKHMLAFVLALAQQELIHPTTAAAWLAGCRKHEPLPEEEAQPLVEAALERSGPKGLRDWTTVETSPTGW